jgi:hypothetical protein
LIQTGTVNCFPLSAEFIFKAKDAEVFAHVRAVGTASFAGWLQKGLNRTSGGLK